MTLRDRSCKACGAVFSGGPRAWYCPACRLERRRAQDRAYKARKKEGQHRPIGSVDVCVVCGQEYEVAGGNQRYCPDCAPEAIAEVDRQQAMEWYEKNKDIINPARKVARRIGERECVICGAGYTAPTATKCCSDACRRELNRQRQRRADAKRSPRKK